MRSIAYFLFIAIFLAVTAYLYTPYETAVERILALLLVGAVFVGFCLRPTRELFYVQTSVRSRESGGHHAIKRDQLAVKIELVRLWLLFVPTALAVCLLVVSSAGGTTPQLGLLGRLSFANYIASYNFFSPFGLVAITVLYWLPFLLLIGLGLWINERWIVRKAEACSATSFRVRGKGLARSVTYAFRGEHGEYFGGDCLFTGMTDPFELSSIVVYKVDNPNRSRIATGFFFHKFVIIGRGLADLDQQNVRAQAEFAKTLQPSWEPE
jgi:hypothetical protein